MPTTVTMDACYAALGVQRGCSVEEVKKAYRRKALALHPDRNPSGADEFKRVNAAYAKLTEWLRFSDGGKENSLFHAPAAGMSAANAGSSTFTDEPLIPEEELFADITPGGWQGVHPDPRRMREARKAREDARRRAKAEMGRERRVPFSQQRPTAPADAATNMTSAAHLKAMYNRYPNSMPSSFASVPPRRDGASAEDDTAPRVPLRPVSGSPQGATSLDCSTSLSSQDTMPYAPPPLAGMSKNSNLYEQWMRVGKSIDEKLHRARQQGNGGEAAEGEYARRAEQELEREKQRVAEAAERRQEEREAAAAQLEQKLQSEVYKDELAAQRRALQRQLFLYKYTPDPADVGAMSDAEVYLLYDIYGDVKEKLQRVLEARAGRGKCLHCGAKPRDAKSGLRFACSDQKQGSHQHGDDGFPHVGLCTDCAQSAVSCPLCAAPVLSAPAASDGSPSFSGSRAAKPEKQTTPTPTPTPTSASTPTAAAAATGGSPPSPRIEKSASISVSSSFPLPPLAARAMKSSMGKAGGDTVSGVTPNRPRDGPRRVPSSSSVLSARAKNSERQSPVQSTKVHPRLETPAAEAPKTTSVSVSEKGSSLSPSPSPSPQPQEEVELLTPKNSAKQQRQQRVHGSLLPLTACEEVAGVCAEQSASAC